MAEPKKKGFWGGLFRSRSNAKMEKGPPRRASEGDALPHRRRNEGPEIASTRRRPRRPPPRDAKGKGKEQPNGHVYEQTPLSEWPPSGISSEEELTLGRAMELISRGVPAHKGHKRPIAHASDRYYGLYATTAGNHGDENDAANQHDAMTQLMTLRVQGSGPPTFPWETLEQPSLAFGNGSRPGTITLNSWVSRSSAFPPLIALRDPGMVPREVDLSQIFDRLKDLEAGLDDDNEDLLYRLYKRFLRDPDKVFSLHKRMEQQITDLVMCLSSPDWIDLTNPKNQVVTKFIYDTGPTNHDQYHKFFYQLLLSLELELRINSRLHQAVAKERLMGQIPPKIQWNLALARRWRDYVRVEEYGKTADEVRLRYKLRKRQTKMLKRFAQMMKWPNLAETLEELKRREADATLVSVSSHAMAFFSGLVLPGPTFPFLMMNSLIDIDPDKATDDLALLTHLHPQCGFQYRNSYTYWTSTCIVGKVIGPTCLEVAGWVGPARPTADLERSQIARIRSRKPRQRLEPEDVTSMNERSDPLGPAAEVFPVKEYELLTPNAEDMIHSVRIELLKLHPLVEKHAVGPKWFDASIQFAIDGESWPFRLAYDVSFINAWPCSDGPHPLFFDYVYTAVKADEVMDIINWGLPGSKEGSAQSTPIGSSKPASPIAQSDDAERVLVIEAFGVSDNEVLVRAWCSYWGLNAVVADIGKTCMACAIREAYAAALTVVILVEDQPGGAE
ncbi:Uu.00g071570.m01.CDS01 [Anthostomella pinea]|uniref:Uu.00g071570.m01.CDS01 n=1 Tax=Anthostomella pinea TaxID=933095 RepID=A0AAI8VUW2_9PEZI|nr:Uu.00g071570.m01.CDS01 [Anthostomella pinea]